MMPDPQPLPRYLPRRDCHREIRAVSIAAVHLRSDRIAVLELEVPYAPVTVTAEWVAEYKPEPGGFYVIYRNGTEGYLAGHIFHDKYERTAG
jgi:hypothetical protein